MAIKDLRTSAVKRGRKFATSGYMNVIFYDNRRRSFTCRVIGPGTTAGLKIKRDADRRVFDNVPEQTAPRQAYCYRPR